MKKTRFIAYSITHVIKYRTFLFVGLALAGFALFSSFILADNDPVILKIITQLTKWTDDYPIEKVYLQFDKPYYAAGDDIWFKAYLTVGGHHQLSALSGTLNVELINKQDSVKNWIKLPVIQGTAAGDFKLPDTLHGGRYRVRAYTNWMRNAGPGYYFDKTITIANSPADSVFAKSSYAYAIVNNQQQVTATINYTNSDGKALVNKPIVYAVQYNGKEATHGKNVTDDKGNITLSFIKPGGAITNKGIITTGLKLSEKNTVAKTLIINATSGKADVQFFPESGSLVNGLNSRVAFKAVGPNGFGVSIKGSIIDNENNKLASFSTQHLGMGSFNIIPQSGKTYKAQITYEDGSESTVNLPEALNSGYVLTINNKADNRISLGVAGSKDLADAGNVYVVAQSGGEVCYVGQSQSQGEDFNASIPKSRFPAGIVQFTLFSAKGEPLNERIAFIEHPDSLLKLDVHTAKSISAAREKVRVEFDVKNDGKPAVGSFSATVVDDGKVPFDESDETSILSHLLLTSDLRGYIEKPNYYFNQNNETTRADLDVLMLTQGYRRFEWKPVLAGTLPAPVYAPQKLINVMGTVKTLSGKAAGGAKVTMISPTAGMPFMLDTIADGLGVFTFKNLLLEDSVRFAVKAYAANGGKNVDIRMLNNDHDAGTEDNALAAINFESSYDTFSPYLKADNKLYREQLKYGLGNHEIALKEVVIKDHKKVSPWVEHSSNLNGPGNANQVLTSDDLEKRGCLTLDDCLNGMLVGVVFYNNTPRSLRTGPPMGGATTKTPKGGNMTIIIDGVPQDKALEKNILGTVPVHDVASIEVLRDGGLCAIYGSLGLDGIILITTKHGDEKTDVPKTTEPGTLIYTPKGYYRAREFYSPQYDDPKTNLSVADLRTTIYWKPNVVTDKDGHAYFEYYNAGAPGTYRVIIEGVDAAGHLGRQVYRYRVQ